MKIKTSNRILIDVSEWDKIVLKTYGKPYYFQQQYGCQGRGIVNLSIPDKFTEDEEMHDSIKFIVNGPEEGVKFKIWLESDVNEINKKFTRPYEADLFWSRNFYPDLQTVANDLHKKGLIDAGQYAINIDW